MITTFLRYPLSGGYLHHWLVAGPQHVRAEAGDAPAPPSAGPDLLRRFFEPASGITEAPIDLGPLGLASANDPVLTWRYYHCRDDHFVDFSTTHRELSYARAWAYAQLSAPAAQAAPLVLTTNGPADVWLNGQHLHRHDHVEQSAWHSLALLANLQSGVNEILIRFESAGVRETPHLMALQVQGLSEAEIRLPTQIEPELLAKRQALEQLVEHATLDRYVYGFMDGDHYNRNEPIPLSFSSEAVDSGEITVRLQSLAGDIYQEATQVFTAGATLELAKTFPLRNGPHHLALQPNAHEYYQKRLRFERKDLFHIVRTPYTEKSSSELNQRRQEALADAAERRNHSLYCEIAKMALERWDKVNLKILNQAIERVNQRQADSVSELLGLVGGRLRFRKTKNRLDTLQPSLYACLAGYDYRSVEAGPSGESAELLQLTSELLAGQLLPDRVFSHTRKTGRWHRQRAEAALTVWIQHRGRYGFRAWDSPADVEASLAALSHVVELARSTAIRELASVLMDKIFFSLAINSFHGAYGSTRGASDTASVLSARLEPTSGIARLMWGQGNFNESLMGTVSLANCRRYDLPDVIRDIARDPGQAFWSQERHMSPPTSSAEATVWEVNKVTYKTQDFMLASAQDYAAGQPGDREHIWQATLGPDAIVYVNHPTCLSEADAHRPNLWRGNGVLPRVAQWGDVVMAIYKLPSTDWLGFTHAYFPTAAFDDYQLHDHWAFARKGAGYLALRSTQAMTLITHGPTAYRELRSVGTEAIWLCHMGQALLDGDFENFQRKILAMEVSADGLALRLKSLRNDALAFGWEGPLWVNGAEQPLSGFRHMENPYSTVDLPASEMEIVYQERGLRLTFE